MATVGSHELTSEAYHKQWAAFQEQAYQLFTAANDNENFTGIIWTNTLTSDKNHNLEYIDKDKYIIQVWTTGTDSTIADLLDKGYRVIFSNYDAWYLVCGFGAWLGDGNNWCHPYHVSITGQKVYEYNREKNLFLIISIERTFRFFKPIR